MSLSRRYAKAFFDLTVTGQTLGTVRRDLELLEELLQGTPELLALFSNPFLEFKEVERLLTLWIKKEKISEETQNFLRILGENRRLKKLLQIIQEFKKYTDQHENRLCGEVSSAQALTESQIKKMTALLSNKLGANVQLREKIDPDLLGGLVIHLGPYLIDSSLKNQLNKLRIALKG